MKLREAISQLGSENATKIAIEKAKDHYINWDQGIGCVFSVIAQDLDRIPGNIGGNSDDVYSVIGKWVAKYKAGMDSCASKRISNLPGTIADPIIEQMIASRLRY